MNLVSVACVCPLCAASGSKTRPTASKMGPLKVRAVVGPVDKTPAEER
jgi:hypothetical protein